MSLDPVSFVVGVSTAFAVSYVCNTVSNRNVAPLPPPPPMPRLKPTVQTRIHVQNLSKHIEDSLHKCMSLPMSTAQLQEHKLRPTVTREKVVYETNSAPICHDFTIQKERLKSFKKL